MTALIFGLLFSEGLLLPEKIITVHHLITTDQGFFVADTGELAIFHLDDRGRLEDTYQRKGLGPGELLSLIMVRHHGDRLYLLDKRARKLVIIDESLAFREQHILSPAVYHDMVLDDHHIVFFAPSPSTGKTIHVYDHDMNPIRSFGEIWEEDLFGDAYEARGHVLNYNTATLTLRNGKLCVSHVYRLAVSFYDLEGRSSKTVPLPGLDFRDLLEEGAPMDVCAPVSNLDREGRIQIPVTNRHKGSRPEITPRYYRLDPENMTWSVAHCRPWLTWPHPEGGFYQARRDAETDRIRLVHLVPEFIALTGPE